MGIGKNIMLLSSLAGAGMAEDAKKEVEKEFFKPGYNAVQASVGSEDNTRFRAYNGFSLDLGSLELEAKTMNESDDRYFSGWETLELKKKDGDVGLLSVTRVGGPDLHDVHVRAQGFGVRADLGKILPFGMYGSVDALVNVKVDDRDKEFLGDGEVFLFAGKEIYDFAVNGVLFYRPGGNVFKELEILGPKIGDKVSLRPMFRLEAADFKNPEYLIGLQAEW